MPVDDAKAHLNSYVGSPTQTGTNLVLVSLCFPTLTSIASTVLGSDCSRKRTRRRERKAE
jgi:hypothetical protein